MLSAAPRARVNDSTFEVGSVAQDAFEHTMLLLFQLHTFWSSRSAHRTGYKAALARIVQEKVSGDRVGCDFREG